MKIVEAGGPHGETLQGTGGEDLFLLAKDGFPHQEIWDFEPGNDLIDLTAFGITWEDLEGHIRYESGAPRAERTVVVDLTPFGGPFITMWSTSGDGLAWPTEDVFRFTGETVLGADGRLDGGAGDDVLGGRRRRRHN